MDTWITFPPPLVVKKRFFDKAKESTATSFALSTIRGALRGAAQAAESASESLSNCEPRQILTEIVQLHLVAAERGLLRGTWADSPAQLMFQVLVGALCSASGDSSIAHLKLGKVAEPAFAEIESLRRADPAEARYLLETLRESWHFDSWNVRRADHLRFMQAAMHETGMSSMLSAITSRGGLMPDTMRVHFDKAATDSEILSAASYSEALIARCGGARDEGTLATFLTVVFGAICDEAAAHTKRYTIS